MWDVTIRAAPFCLLVTGMPGAGKSTVTGLVAERLPRSARLVGDEVNRMVVGGFVSPLGEPTDEAARQVTLLHRNLCALAGNVADAGFTPLVDAVIPSRENLGFFLDALAPRRVALVVLAPGVGTCRSRNAVRDPRDRCDFDGYDALDAGMRHGFGDIGWWLDTSALSPGVTADLIVAEAGRRAPVNRSGTGTTRR